MYISFMQYMFLFAKFPSNFPTHKRYKLTILFNYVSFRCLTPLMPHDLPIMGTPMVKSSLQKTRGGAFDLCRCGWINELGEPNAAQFHKFHTDKLFFEDWLGVSSIDVCVYACVFFIGCLFFLVFCWKFLVAGMFFADN